MTEHTYPRLVHWSYFDGNGLLSNKSSKERLTKVYITDEKGESVLNHGKVACLTSRGLFQTVQDPYFKMERTEGFTRKAKRHGDMRRKMQNEHPDTKDTLTRIAAKVMDYNDYVYLNVAFLENEVNSFAKIEENKEAFFNANFVYKQAFTAAFLEKLIDYKPRSLFDRGVITTYHERELPALFAEIKIKYPALYKEVLETSSWLKEHDEALTYVGKQATVHSLNPGPVTVTLSFIDKVTFEWDGTTLTSNRQLDNGEWLTQSITPSKDMVVTICNDCVVGEDTQLIN